MKFNFFLYLIVALSIMACCKSDDDNKVHEATAPSTGNYMNVFITKPGELILEFDKYGASSTSEIKMWIPSDEGCCVSYAFEDDLIMYKRCAEFYGDTTYHGVHELGNSSGCVAPLSNIVVKTDKDFDEAHPAGATLNDLFQIRYPGFYNYIKSGYKPKEGLGSEQLDSISELAVFKDVSLFSGHTSLIFKQLPATPGKYTFTVTLTFGEDPLTGEKVELAPASIEIEF